MRRDQLDCDLYSFFLSQIETKSVFLAEKIKTEGTITQQSTLFILDMQEKCPSRFQDLTHQVNKGNE